MTAQSFEKWLKAAADQAAQEWALGLHLADPRGVLNPAGRRDAHEADLDSADRWLLTHARQPRRRPARVTPGESPARYLGPVL